MLSAENCLNESVGLYACWRYVCACVCVWVHTLQVVRFQPAQATAS